METNEEHQGEPFRLFTVIVIGFLIVIIGIINLIVAAILSDGDFSIGAFILIGPIPIVIGAGPEAQWLAPIAIVLTMVSVITYIAVRRRIVRNSD